MRTKEFHSAKRPFHFNYLVKAYLRSVTLPRVLTSWFKRDRYRLEDVWVRREQFASKSYAFRPKITFMGVLLRMQTQQHAKLLLASTSVYLLHKRNLITRYTGR